MIENLSWVWWQPAEQIICRTTEHLLLVIAHRREIIRFKSLKKQRIVIVTSCVIYLLRKRNVL